MSCCCDNNKTSATKTVTLAFHRRHLLYDVANYAFVEGEIVGEDAEHVHHQVTDITEEGNVDRVTRVLNLAHAEVVELLYPYTKEEISDEGETLDDAFTEPEAYEVMLRLPGDFSKTTVELLRQLIHEYLVCRVLHDWLTITYPESSVVWEAKLEAMRDKIRTALMSRMKTLRRRLSPF